MFMSARWSSPREIHILPAESALALDLS